MNSPWLMGIKTKMKASLLSAKEFAIMDKIDGCSLPDLLHYLRFINKYYPQFLVMVGGHRLLYFFHATDEMKQYYLPGKVEAFAIVEKEYEQFNFEEMSFSCSYRQEKEHMEWHMSDWKKMTVLHFLQKEKVL